MKKILILFLISGSVLTASAQVNQSPAKTPTTNAITPATTTPSTTQAPLTSTSTPIDNNASAQTGDHDYYFYPSQNVYYDKTSGNYWYRNDPSATTWTQTSTLPSTMNLENEKSYPIQYNGNDPWKNNTADMKKYNVNDNGTMETQKH